MNEQLKDLAWAAIPPECRKEIKFEYAFSDNKEILGDIFGHHNLTSNEEPDLPDPTEEKPSNGAIGTTPPASKLDVKPTPKFKIGDKVRITDNVVNERIGKVFEIVGLPENTRQLDNDVRWTLKEILSGNIRNHFACPESQFEPCTEPEPQQMKSLYKDYPECVKAVDDLMDEYMNVPQQTEENMEEKELNLLTLLKGCENETIYMPDEGLCKITQVLDDSITVFVKGKSWATSLKGETLEIKTTGFAYIYPSKESFLKYPLEAAKAWSEWKSERKPKYHIDAQLLLFEEGSLIDNINICDIKFKSLEVAKQAAEAVKRTLMEFHEKNAEK